jgi:hypothetical protein
VPERLAQRCTKALAQLSAEMAKPVPDVTAVQKGANEAVTSLGLCLDALAFKRLNSAEIEALIKRLDARNFIAGWDDAAQRYLALVPLLQSWIDLVPSHHDEQENLKARLEGDRRGLEFPGGLDSPKDFDPRALRSGGGR